MASKISLREVHAKLHENKPVAQYFFYDKSDVYVNSSAERIKPNLVKLSVTNDEIFDIGTSSILDDLNKSIREHRRRIFYHKLMTNKKAKKIVSEGDSWHLYPLFIDELVDQLNKDKNLAIYSVDGAGDTIYDMSLKQFNDEFEGALGASKLANPVTVLLNGGGNDLLNMRKTSTGKKIGNLFFHLNDYQTGMTAKQILKPTIDGEIISIIGLMKYMIAKLESLSSVSKVVIHGYDYSFPDNDIWLGKPMNARGIPSNLQRSIVVELMDRYDLALRDLTRLLRKTTYVDLRGTVTKKNDWFDEIHPKSAGFKKMATKVKPYL